MSVPTSSPGVQLKCLLLITPNLTGTGSRRQHPFPVTPTIHHRWVVGVWVRWALYCWENNRLPHQVLRNCPSRCSIYTPPSPHLHLDKTPRAIHARGPIVDQSNDWLGSER